MTPVLEHRDVCIEQHLGKLLRASVALAAAVVLFGAIVYLATHGSDQADYRTFQPAPADLRSIDSVLHAAVLMNGAAIIQLGMLLLIATPILRVAFSAYAFLRQRDARYVIITLLVLGNLSYALFVSK